MATLKFAVVTCVILAVVGISSSGSVSWIQGTFYCKTPDGHDGDCIPLAVCKTYTKLSIISQISGLSRESSCGFRRTGVCCPRTTIKKSHDPINLLPLDSCGTFDNSRRISNGSPSALFAFPWMAQLGYKIDNEIEYRCSGTLINNKYVLTAAHCIKPRNKPIIIRLGEYNMSSPTDCNYYPDEDPICAEPPQDIEIEDILRHKDYEAENFSNDIALIRLKTNAKFTNKGPRPICLPIQPSLRSKTQSSVIITGWGLTEEGSPSDVLRQGVVDIVNSEFCKNLFKTTTIGENQICLADRALSKGKLSSRSALKVKPVGTCSGDSGGPIQAKQEIGSESRYVQYGVVSSGVACSHTLGAGIHTRIDRYLDWIKNNIKP